MLIPSACEGYGDFTDQVAYLDENSTYSLTVTTGYGDQHVKVWIDFNDDSNFTSDEVVVPSPTCNVTSSFDFVNTHYSIPQKIKK